MTTAKNWSLLIASYCVWSINMLIEVVAHPNASDHAASITGLLFLIVTLIALVINRPPGFLVLVTVLNLFIAVVGGYLIVLYLYRRGVNADSAKDLIVRAYFGVLVPIFAVRYFIATSRGLNLSIKAPSGP